MQTTDMACRTEKAGKRVQRLEAELAAVRLELQQTHGKLHELEASQENLRSLVLTIPDVVYRIDAAGNFTFVNDAVRRLGYEPAELLGRHFREIVFPEDLKNVSRCALLPQYKGKITGPLRAPGLLDERRTGNRRTMDLEVRLVFKSPLGKGGAMASRNRDFIVAEVNSAGIWQGDMENGSKEFAGTVGVMRDVSYRKRMENALRESEQRLKSIFACTQAGIILIDAQSRTIVDANPAALRLVGAARSRTVGAVCHQYICPEEKGRCPVLDLGQKVDHAERVLRTAEGGEIPILKTVAEIELDGGRHLIESFVDIRHIKEVEAELQQARHRLELQVEQRTADLQRTNLSLQQEIQRRIRTEAELQALLRQLRTSQSQLVQAEKLRALGTLTAGVAHELNNPMMGMLNFIQYCLKHTLESDRRFAVLQDAECETRRCIEIVQNLLTFAPAEASGDPELKTEPLETIIDRVLRLLSFRIAQENVRILREMPAEPLFLKCRRSSIQQVFLNLMDNAMDAMKDCEAKKITINAEASEGEIRIAFSDSGCGVPAEAMPKLFDPFFTTKPPGHGTGLGLAVSRSIIESHGGRITCRNVPGAGAALEIFLPSSGY